MWPISLSEDELKKIKSILGNTNVVGAESVDYMIFKCTKCDKEIEEWEESGIKLEQEKML